MIELTTEEIRVLGSLVEKEATTPDNYPLSTNALVGACNQSTNRDPVVNYSERDVDRVVLALREQGLARTVRGDGQRVHKHRHVLDEALRIERESLAVLSILMLRGPQTVAELRSRSARYGVALEAESVEAHLEQLARRDDPLVRRLDRRPGEREARWVHLLGGEALAAEQAATSRPGTIGVARRSAPGDGVAELEERVARLERRLDVLLARLGETIDHDEPLAGDEGDPRPR